MLCLIIKLLFRSKDKVWCKTIQNIIQCAQKHQWLIVWLLGGLILQQMSSLWFFTSLASNINYIRSALLLGCSPKLGMKIRQQLLKLSRSNVQMLSCVWYFINWRNGSPTKNWWMQWTSSIFNINLILLLKKHSRNT